MVRHAFSVVMLAAFAAAVSARPLHAAPILDAQTMKAALHTDTPEEEGFIEYVFAKVSKGQLPESLVNSTFLWARKKPRHQFQYFKRGLILRATELGIKL